jgi:hypothetical protein
VSDEDATRYLDALARGENPKPPKAVKAREHRTEDRWK